MIFKKSNLLLDHILSFCKNKNQDNGDIAFISVNFPFLIYKKLISELVK